MKQERDFKGIWIPKEIWLDKRLTALEKTILAEIDSLDVENEGCYATNEYLAEFCGCSECKISLAIKKLIELDYLELASFNGRERILKSRLLKSKRQTSKKYEANSTITSNMYNTMINIDDKKKNIKKKSLTIPPTLSEIKAYCEERNNFVNPEAFYDFYESKNWMIGKNKMKDWQAAVRTWEKLDSNGNKQKNVKPKPDWYTNPNPEPKSLGEEEIDLSDFFKKESK